MFKAQDFIFFRFRFQEAEVEAETQEVSRWKLIIYHSVRSCSKLS